MRVLLVAPRKNDLVSVDEELQDIYGAGLDIVPLVGKVTALEVIRKIRDGDYDVLWFASHGDDAGVELSGLERLSASELVPLVRGRFSLVVLNTCNGWGIAQLLQEEANVGVMFALSNVPDVEAYHFGSGLASALATTNNYAAAYLASKPGHNKTYLYLPSLRVSQDSIDGLAVEMRELKEAVVRDTVWLWRWLYVSSALHVVELICIVWLTVLLARSGG